MNLSLVNGYPLNTGGGIGRFTLELAENLVTAGNTVMLVLPGETNNLSRLASGVQLLTIKSMINDELALTLTNTRNLRFLHNHLAKFKPRVVHAQDTSPLSFVCQDWALNHKVQFGLTLHLHPTKMLDYGLVEFSGAWGTKYSQYLVKDFVLNFMRSCAFVTTPNQSVAVDAAQFGYDQPVVVIPNGKKLTDYAQSKAVDSANCELLFIGHLSSRKQQLYLLEVMRYLQAPRYSLALIGKALTANYQQKLLNYIQEHKLTNVQLLGAVDYEAIADYLQRAKFFVSASKLEVQSLVIIEALASGTPVIALENDTISELVDAQVGASLPLTTAPEEFAAQVRLLDNLNIDSYQRLSQQARQRVANLDWAIVINRYLELYQGFLPHKRHNRKTKVLMAGLVGAGTLASVGLLTYTLARNRFKKSHPAS